jgi:hypothetical protein
MWTAALHGCFCPFLGFQVLVNAMNKENSLGFEDDDWDGKQIPKQKV